MEKINLQHYLDSIKAQEKVCIFIDNSNLFHALRAVRTEEKRLDYSKLKNFLAEGRTTMARFYYSMPFYDEGASEEIKIKIDNMSSFYNYLETRLGFFMIEFPLRVREKQEVICQKCGSLERVPAIHKEKGLDCEIVYDMATLARTGNFDSFILVAGDEDYARTVRRIRNETGMPVDVAFFENSGCSQILMNEASKFIELNRLELFRDPKSLYRETS